MSGYTLWKHLAADVSRKIREIASTRAWPIMRPVTSHHATCDVTSAERDWEPVAQVLQLSLNYQSRMDSKIRKQ